MELGVVLGILAVAFLIFGWMNQSDYLDTLSDNLNIATTKFKIEQGRATEAAGEANLPKGIIVALSSAQRFAVDICSQPIVVEVKQRSRPHEDHNYDR